VEGKGKELAGMCAYMCACVFMCAYEPCMYVYVCVCMRVYACVCMCVCMCVCCVCMLSHFAHNLMVVVVQGGREEGDLEVKKCKQELRVRAAEMNKH